MSLYVGDRLVCRFGFFHCEEINAQRKLLKLQTGTWPASKEDLITKYKKEFFVFIESIDFDNLKV
jgi:hypothetical protein